MNHAALIPKIYDVIANPNMWPSVLDDIVQCLDASAANVFVGDAVHDDLQGAWYSHAIKDISAGYEKMGFFELERTLYEAVPTMLTERDLTPEPIAFEKYKRFGYPSIDFTQLHHWLLNEYGIAHRCITPLNHRPNYFDFLTVHFGKNHFEPPAESLKNGNLLLPHLAKAIEINRPFVLLQERFRAVLEVLDRFHLGVIIVGNSKTVWLKNSSASQILDRRDGLSLSSIGKLSATKASQRVQLNQLIEDLSKKLVSNTDTLGRKMVVERSERKTPYIIDLSPLSNKDLSDRTGPSGVLMIIVDPDRPEIVNSKNLAALFGLTPKEQQVSDLVIKGHSSKDIAEIRNVSPETIITQMKSLFLKTNIHKRCELIHLAHSINIPIDPPDRQAD